MTKSKLTRKAQTTIPLPVRNALRLVEGNEFIYTIQPDQVILCKALRHTADDRFATFAEWSSDADSRGYADL